MRLFFISLAAPIILSACATDPNAEPRPKGVERYADDPRLGEEVKRVCFTSTIDGFSENERDTVVVRKGMDHYLIEVFGSCNALEHAQLVGFDSHMSCLSKGDSLVVSESIAGPRNEGLGGQRCMITAIYDWDPDATDEAEASEESPSEEDSE